MDPFFQVTPDGTGKQRPGHNAANTTTGLGARLIQPLDILRDKKSLASLASQTAGRFVSNLGPTKVGSNGRARLKSLHKALEWQPT